MKVSKFVLFLNRNATIVNILAIVSVVVLLVLLLSVDSIYDMFQIEKASNGLEADSLVKKLSD